MQIKQLSFTNGKWENNSSLSINPQLVIAFGSRKLLEENIHFDYLKKEFPQAHIVTCSTAGEIYADGVLSDSIQVTALEFKKGKISTVVTNINNYGNSTEAGHFLAHSLASEGLRFVMVYSDGGVVNGSELVQGMSNILGSKIPLAGGLAGDGEMFTKTLVGLDNYPQVGNVVAIGFYGDDFVFGTGMMGGWEVFGIERTVTKSNKNVLYEIDSKSALDLYKVYLGKYVDELPGAALLFPLALKTDDENDFLVRTILNIDEENKSMTFAGNIPEGSKVRMMKANIDRLIDSVTYAAQNASDGFTDQSPQLAILVSCVGRRIVLGQRVEEEIESVREILGSKTAITGFYSYGEVSPFNKSVKCELHNQSMTIITISEK